MKTWHALAVAATCIMTCGCAVGRHHTTDAVLSDGFLRHRSEFERLLSDVRQDEKLQAIQPHVLIYATHWFDLDQPASSAAVASLGLGERRLAWYQQQLRVLKLEGGVMQRQEEVEFRVDPGSILNGDSYKGYVYRSKIPPHLLADLDGYSITDRDKTALGNWSVYKPLIGNWYLYLFVNR